ncbi:MaoC family dehydratase [Nocardia sp. CA-290969]|uniref:MaoC family dehydratase n=1 Tax=Nocardia sp. CA-290969 TaxID=3239986 RepID=UPI003D90875B
MIAIDAAEDPGKHNGAEAVTEWQLLSQQQVTDFADASDDRNPLHVDPDFARTTPYGSTIAHGY